MMEKGVRMTTAATIQSADTIGMELPHAIARAILTILLFGFLSYAPISAQPTGRIINIYTPVVTIDSCFITVESSSGFSVGDRVLIIQMQGATANSSNTDAFGSTTDLHDVGNFEFGTIRHIGGNDISLVKKLARTYDPASRVQMVRVPRYKDLTIGDLVTAQPWNGRVGGVVALEATGTVTITASGSIDVSETGFRGGKALDVNRGCGGMVDFFYPASDDRGASKGEGIAIPQSTMQNGKGAWTNGGGGGNNHNAGGGGGALVGSGGFGGCEWSGCSTENLATRGIGGYGLSYSQTPARAFMGGGGGAGHTNNFTGTSGGNGGGIIILRAGALTGSGKLLSNGQTVPLTTDHGQDGCGGGGSAGSIFLDVATPGGSLTVSLKGGDGGSTTFYEKVGPGGGGSGGLLWVSGPTVPSTMQISSKGGGNGTHVYSDDDTWKATPGENGTTLTNLMLPPLDESDISLPDLRRDLCPGDSVRLSAPPGVFYHWTPADGLSCTDCREPMASPSATTRYIVTVGYGEGCATSDTIDVVVHSSARIIGLHIPREARAYPGAPIMVPLVLDTKIDAAEIDSFRFSIDYEPSILQLRNIFTANTGTDGWTVDVIAQEPGHYQASVTAPPGGSIHGTGTLLNIMFRTFVGDTTGSDLRFTVELGTDPCTIVVAQPGHVELDSICGLALRLIQPGIVDYALEPNRPNPFNPTTEIPFSIGLDGKTRLTIHDASGALVAVLLDRYMMPGRYTVVWDAGNVPSGIYYYRLVSGDWSRSGAMMLVR